MKKIIFQAIIITLIIVFKGIEQKLLEGHNTNFIDIIIGYILFVFTLSFIANIIVYIYRKNKNLGSKETDNITSGINNIHAVVVGSVGILTGIALIGIDVKGLFASLSIIAAAVALISKDYISNILGGMFIAFSNDLTLGDYIKVGNNKGRVINMSVSMLSILTDDDDVVILPNSMVYALELVNYTKREIKKTSIEFEIALSALTSVKQLEDDLILILEDYHHLIQPDSYNLKTVAIKKDFVEFKFQYILAAPDRELEKDIRKKVIRKVIRTIKNLDN